MCFWNVPQEIYPCFPKWKLVRLLVPLSRQCCCFITWYDEYIKMCSMYILWYYEYIISYFNITSLFSNNFPETSSFKLLCEIGQENMTPHFANEEKKAQKVFSWVPQGHSIQSKGQSKIHISNFQPHSFSSISAALFLVLF